MPDDATKVEFGKRLRALLSEAGLKQVEFVTLVQAQMPKHGNFSRSHLTGYLAGRHYPRPIVLHAMCRALKVKPDQLTQTAMQLEK